MQDENVEHWMENSILARAFIMKDALGYGLKQKADKAFSEDQQNHKEVIRKTAVGVKMQDEK